MRRTRKKDCWAVLGLEPGAPLREARKAWRAAVRRHHPDRGGDLASFLAAQEAWMEIKQEVADGRRPARTACRAASRPAPDQAEVAAPWTYARAVRWLVDKVAVDIETMEDGSTGFAGAEIVWLSDEGVEWDEGLVTWKQVDDQIMADAEELLVMGAERLSG